MDVRRYSAHHPPPPPQHPPPPSHHQPHQQSQVDPRAPPYSPHYPPQHHQPVQYPQPQQQQLQHPSPHQPQHHQHQHQHQQPPAPAPPPHNPSPIQQQQPYSNPPSTTPPRPQQHLPPIQQPYGPPPTLQEQKPLPPFRHPSQSQSQPHDPRDSQQSQQSEEYPPYTQGRSEHATPAPVNRSFSHDPQRTPTTPQAGPYPSGLPDGAPPAPQHSMEHGHHGPPMTNGVHHGLPPPSQQHPPPHDPHAPPYTPIDGYHGYPPAQPMYAPYAPGPATSSVFQVQQRKKQMRATQACEQCRQRKQKCDEGSPCSFCKDNNLACSYRDTPPVKTDKNMEKLLSYMENMEKQISTVQETLKKFDTVDARVRQLEQTEGTVRSGTERPASSDGGQVALSDDGANKSAASDHRTAPHKLLMLWPSVSKLLQATSGSTDKNTKHRTTYVMEAESRGILRLHTRGEGVDPYDGTQPGESVASPPEQSETSSTDSPKVNGAVSSPPEGVWGTGFPQTPQSDARRSEFLMQEGLTGDSPRKSNPLLQGGLKLDGTLDLDETTLNTLFDSYMTHMHVMHPFLHKPRIREMLNRFIKHYSRPQMKRTSSAAFAVDDNSGDFERSAKRQRSNGSTAVHMPPSDSTFAPTTPTERSPANAIIYLVLALGKICLYDGPLPSLVPENGLAANETVIHQINGAPGFSPILANMKPSPTSPIAQPTPPGHDSAIHPPFARNIDIIPGLAYYAKAAEIIGDQTDGNDLVHAQMFLLAGLYKGQLARVKESMSFFQMAGRALLNLLDTYKLYNSNYWGPRDADAATKIFEKGLALMKNVRDNLIVLAAWTCLQLESDILAELRLPSSGIQANEDILLMPNLMDENYKNPKSSSSRNRDHDTIMLYYSAQTFLRRKLNSVHREMYGHDYMNLPLGDVCEMLRGHDSMLTLWRQLLPTHLQWKDSEPPPNDILPARLRAKFWGARYVVNRPFLDYALHILPHVKEGRKVRDVALDAEKKPRDLAEIHLFEAIQGMPESEVWEASRRCIEAAMHSTVAFDGMPNRLIVTNIHGTAHAQFGNMLVLAATYSTHLRALIEEDRFRYLLNRTIKFLHRLAPISPTCKIDCGLLEMIERKLFGVPKEALDVYKGEKHFYSNDFVDPPSATTSFGGST